MLITAYMHACMSHLQLESVMHARIVTPMGGVQGAEPPLCHTKRIIALNAQRGYITLVIYVAPLAVKSVETTPEPGGISGAYTRTVAGAIWSRSRCHFNLT